jgi:hippurate hydrolase
MPHATRDPVVLAAQTVLALQTIVSREVNPLEPAVVTVGSIHAGTKHNIIPEEARLQLTVRAFRPEVRRQILAAIERIVKNLAAAAGVPPERAPVVTISEEEYTPATVNDPELVRRLVAVLGEVLGPENVLPTEPMMPGEDFSRYGMEEPRVPIAMLWLGAVDPARYREAREKGLTLPPLHSAEFLPLAEPAIRTGIRVLSAAALHLMKR